MNTIDISSLAPQLGGAARFEGIQHGAQISFFVVTSPPGKGADKHRHPYEETFVLLDGDIEVIVNGVMRLVSGNTIVIVPANAWHEFKNRSNHAALMVNIHPAPKMVQEDWDKQDNPTIQKER